MEKAMEKRYSKAEIAMHAVSACILLVSISFSIFLFQPVFTRTIKSVKDFGVSIAYYFTELFGFEGVIRPTINDISTGDAVEVLPRDPSEFQAKLRIFWDKLFSWPNCKAFLAKTALILYNVLNVVTQLSLIFVIIILIRKVINARRQPVNNYDEDTHALRIYKKIEAVTWEKLKACMQSYVDFLRGQRRYVQGFIAIWAYNLNAITIVMEIVAYIFYFSISFDFLHLFTLIANVAIDLTVAIDFLPWWIWGIGGCVLFQRWRKKVGTDRLRRFEIKNREFLENHPGALFLTGKQRAKKTTIITDMALSQEQIFRDSALDGMMKRDKQFPFFPWINVDVTLRNGQAVHGLPTLERCRKLIKILRLHFKYQDRYQNTEIFNMLKIRYGYDFDDFIFGYDYERYGLYYNDGLTMVGIFDAIEGYLQQCFIYTAPTSLIFGNYSTRTDLVWEDYGNLPRYDGDFFTRNPQDLENISKFSHIYDYDSGRLGTLMDAANAQKDGFECGVVSLAEIAKERGNQKTNVGKSVKDKECNTANDGYEINVKMQGHASTIDNYTYFRIFYDDQRPDSLGADNKDLCDVVMIKDARQKKVVLPFYGIEMLLGWIAGKLHDNAYMEKRVMRGDNTLPMYLLRKMTAPLFHHVERMTNNYTVYVAKLKVWDAMTEEILNDLDKYYISVKKTYAGRFATDSIKDFYSKKAARSKMGLNDYPTFAGVRMTVDEMNQMHSHFYLTLNKVFGVKASEKVK